MFKPLAYSYVRFSSEKQSQGHSLERQLKLAKDYARANDLILDDHSYRDLGVSAFKGKNAAEGKLGAFIQAVDNNTIKPGSYLLVESLDRLSRADAPKAMTLFMSIIDRGITIVTLGDNHAVYSTERMANDSGMSMIMSILVMVRANEESATKSKRVKAAWAEKAAKGDILTKVCPAWIKHVDGKFVLIEENAKVVRRMFDLYAREGRGSPYIAKLLNEEGIKPFGWAEFWTNGTVASILNNPAAYGTLRRKKADKPSIPNYYPAVVSEETFVSANAAGASRQWKGGRKGTGIANLFSGMSYCGECGSKMRVVSTNRAKTYLKCTRSFNTAACNAKTVSMIRSEAAVLNNLGAWQQYDLWVSMQTKTEDLSAPLRAQLLENDAKLKSLIKLAELTDDVDTIAPRIKELKLQNATLKKKVKDTPAEKTFSTAELDDARAMYERIKTGQLSEEELTPLRSRLQGALRRIMLGVVFWGNEEEVSVVFATGGIVRRSKIESEERYRVNGTFAKRPS